MSDLGILLAPLAAPLPTPWISLVHGGVQAVLLLGLAPFLAGLSEWVVARRRGGLSCPGPARPYREVGRLLQRAERRPTATAESSIMGWMPALVLGSSLVAMVLAPGFAMDGLVGPGADLWLLLGVLVGQKALFALGLASLPAGSGSGSGSGSGLGPSANGDGAELRDGFPAASPFLEARDRLLRLLLLSLPLLVLGAAGLGWATGTTALPVLLSSLAVLAWPPSLVLLPLQLAVLLVAVIELSAPLPAAIGEAETDPLQPPAPEALLLTAYDGRARALLLLGLWVRRAALAALAVSLLLPWGLAGADSDLWAELLAVALFLLKLLGLGILARLGREALIGRYDAPERLLVPLLGAACCAVLAVDIVLALRQTAFVLGD